MAFLFLNRLAEYFFPGNQKNRNLQFMSLVSQLHVAW